MNPISHHRCDCGQPAVKKKQSAYVCARCAALEEHKTAYENRKKKSGEKEPTSHTRLYDENDNQPICGESLALLRL